MKERILLSCDGEDGHLRACLDVLFVNCPSELKDQLFELMKFAAAASKTQQPADVASCYRILKQALRNATGPHAIKALPHLIPLLMEALKEQDEASRTAYVPLLARLPAIISKAFTVHNVRVGWAETGFYPPNPEKVMQRCTWDLMTVGQKKAILDAVPALAQQVMENGELEDANIQAAVGAEINFEKWLERHAKKKIKTGMALQDMVLNRRRAVWVSHPRVLAKYIAMEGHKLDATHEIAERSAGAAAASAGAAGGATILTASAGAGIGAGAAAASRAAATPTPVGATGAVMPSVDAAGMGALTAPARGTPFFTPAAARQRLADPAEELLVRLRKEYDASEKERQQQQKRMKFGTSLG